MLLGTDRDIKQLSLPFAIFHLPQANCQELALTHPLVLLCEFKVRHEKDRTYTNTELDKDEHLHMLSSISKHLKSKLLWMLHANVIDISAH